MLYEVEPGDGLHAQTAVTLQHMKQVNGLWFGLLGSELVVRSCEV